MSQQVDIKATRDYSKWLLVESHKFWSDAYVLVKMTLPRDFEEDISYIDGDQLQEKYLVLPIILI